MTDLPLATLPQGFVAALSRNLNAMRRFTSLTDAQQELIVKEARNARSREEMDRLVGSI
ncbi:MAG: hypothetical protein IJP37_00845 [Clostridia bacterium]|nr:hypothetical protein [Clostridia bacterium]